MIRLSVNVNKVALLRNTRDTGVPDVVRLARLALEAGAHGITVHPRPDGRHIRGDDVTRLAALLREPRWVERGCEINIEGNPFEGEYLRLVAEARPDQCTLVPDTPGQRTSDHGWALMQEQQGGDEAGRLRGIVARLHDHGARVSLFMDPDPDAIARVPMTGADRVELYTEGYARAWHDHRGAGDAFEAEFERYARAAAAAQAAGLGVNAGHDLDLDNLPRFATIPGVLEVSIGHALTADALELGMAGAVTAYLAVLEVQTGDPGQDGPAI